MFSGTLPINTRLTKDLTQYLSTTIAANLESKGVVKYDVSKEAIASQIADVITADMMVEEKLNKDVEKLLSAHEAEIARGQMDYRKVFELTKQKLAKDRGIAERGWRATVNVNRDAHPLVLPVHLHVMGGRPFGWPPG